VTAGLARLAGRDDLLACLLLAVFAILAGGSSQLMTHTYDEGAHYAYGWKILTFDASRGRDDSKMPFSALNALPGRIATVLGPGSLRSRLETIEFGRYMTVAAGVLLGWLVFRWAGALYGPPAGLLALTLLVLDPNILAHAGLVTSDLYATWMTALTIWSFWRFLAHAGAGAWCAATVSAGAFGLAQLSKYTCVYLAPILVLIALGHAAPALWALARGGAYRALGGRVIQAGKYAALYVAAFLLFANIGYWGEGSFKRLSDYSFRSGPFLAVQARLAPLAGLRVPVAAPYLEGLDRVLANERGGFNVYLLGRFGKDGVHGRPFPEYYAVAWLYKEPIPTQVLLLLALAAYTLGFRRFHFRRDEWPLVAAVLAFAWYFTFVFNYQIGIRYALVVHPLLFVLAGSLLRDSGTLSRGARVALAGLLVWLGVSTVSRYPHFLAYFNEFVPDRTQAYRVLIDSNLDWGQSGRYVERYLRRHPDVVLEPGGPQAGTMLVSANNLAGLRGPERFRWLRENFAPVGHVAYTHLLFRVTPEALRRVTDPIPPDAGDKVN
jgi:hypothetical protein